MKCTAVEPELGWKCMLDEHPPGAPGPLYHRDRDGNVWYGRVREARAYPPAEVPTEIPMHPQWCALAAGHPGPCWPSPPGTPERQARDLAILVAYNAGEDVRDIAFRNGLHVLAIRDVITRALARRQNANDESTVR